MKNKKLLAAQLVTIIIVATYFLATNYKGDSIGKPAETELLVSGQPLPSFILRNTRGELVSLQSMRGKVVLLFFGYVNCPDLCPMVLKKYAELERLLGNKVDNVAMVFITTDPYRDTPNALEAYVSSFSPRTTALTGSLEDLAKVWEKYHVRPVEKIGSGNYVSHSALIYVADKNLILRKIFTPEMPGEEMAKELEKLI
ncbi:MAG: SCO family protein [Candidatus Caldarchaeum sp.]|uniref:SCO family protein n=1 Tax=Caldiarchaeum subterraneum TaxID=311458 RepID=A0A7C5Q587_CALS0